MGAGSAHCERDDVRWAAALCVCARACVCIFVFFVSVCLVSRGEDREAYGGELNRSLEGEIARAGDILTPLGRSAPPEVADPAAPAAAAATAPRGGIAVVAYTGSPMHQSGARLSRAGEGVGGGSAAALAGPDGGVPQRLAVAITVGHTVGRAVTGGLTMTPLRLTGGGSSDKQLEPWGRPAGAGRGAVRGHFEQSPGQLMDAALRAIGAAAAPADIPPPTAPRPRAPRAPAPRVPQLQLAGAAPRAALRQPSSTPTAAAVQAPAAVVGDAPELEEFDGEALDRFIATTARQIISYVRASAPGGQCALGSWAAGVGWGWWCGVRMRR